MKSGTNHSGSNLNLSLHTNLPYKIFLLVGCSVTNDIGILKKLSARLGKID